MSGECKSYRLNEPMAWKEFRTMPDDIKITYIKLIRQKFNVPDSRLAKIMGINTCSFSQEMSRLGLNIGKGTRNNTAKWDKDGFYAWANGVDQFPTPVPEEEPIQKTVIISEEPETFVEDDLPFEEPDPIPVAEYIPIPKVAVPNNGSMNFTCHANQALNTIAQLLGETNVSISVMWRVVEEGEDEKC